MAALPCLSKRRPHEKNGAVLGNQITKNRDIPDLSSYGRTDWGETRGSKIGDGLVTKGATGCMAKPYFTQRAPDKNSAVLGNQITKNRDIQDLDPCAIADSGKSNGLKIGGGLVFRGTPGCILRLPPLRLTPAKSTRTKGKKNFCTSNLRPDNYI